MVMDFSFLEIHDFWDNYFMLQDLFITETSKKRLSKKIQCIDFFCGVGGLTHGLIQGGINVVAGIDVDPSCHFAYTQNNPSQFVEASIENISGHDLGCFFDQDKIRVLVGCAPCQSFSTYSQARRQKNHNQQWHLVTEFGRIIKEVNPDLIAMENVVSMINNPVFKKFLEQIGNYHVWYEVVNCANYGVPQSRKRLILLASRFDNIKIIPPTHDSKNIVTVRQAISHLAPLEAGNSDHDDLLHTAPALSPLNLKRIQASKPGGTWRDWEESLLASCHRKNSGKTYPSVYGRMAWDQVAPTITTQCFGYGNGRFGHPEQDRAISLREAAILQTFPEEYQFLPKEETPRFNRIGRFIGNAVPVKIGEVIAQSFLQHLDNIHRKSAVCCSDGGVDPDWNDEKNPWRGG